MERLTLEQAVDILLEQVNTVGVSRGELNKATGQVSAQDLIAAIDVPHFKRSRVDGYVINEQDLLQAAPLTLQKTHITAAGNSIEEQVLPGTTIKVMTGAPIPLNTGAVIKQETVEEQDDTIIIPDIPTIETNIEPIGAMTKKGYPLARQGDVFNPEIIELIATTGLREVPVYKAPTVYVINSGSELELPGGNLEYGQIFNSNQSLFLSLLQLAGCKVITGLGKVNDNLDLICEEIKKGLELSDLLIITGGNSEGDYDLIPPALEKIGATLLVNGIVMKPGHRTVVAAYNNKLLFNLPGNPHAGYILFQVLISPVIRKMRGINQPLNQWFDIQLINNMKSINKARTFCKGALVAENNSLGAIALRKSEINYELAPLVLDIAPNQGRAGDIIKALFV